MADQPRYEPLEASRFFADGSSARHRVPGVVARGNAGGDVPFESGLKATTSPAFFADAPRPSLDWSAGYAETFPVPITAEGIVRGQERFAIHCVPCHDRLARGSGTVVQNGFPRPPTLHSERLRQAPPGYLFDVITRGYGDMPAYGRRIRPRERWEVVAYVRALQLSQHAEIDQLPAALRERFAARE